MDTCLVIPVSFLPSDSTHTNCFKASVEFQPTAIASWGFPELTVDGEAPRVEAPNYGAVVGWDDGSILLLHPNESRPAQLAISLESARSADTTSLKTPSSSRYPHHLSLSLSRPQSPSGTTSLIVPMPKSRAVSGVSKDQAEAPKNYVDFEEEGEKLKQMLGDRAVRGRSTMEFNSLIPERRVGTPSPRLSHARSSPSLPSFPLPSRSDDAMSLMSSRSRGISPSPSATPRLPEEDLFTKSRIISRPKGEGQRVSALEVIESGRYFVSLQANGLVSIFKCLDGVCVASAEPGDMPSQLKTSTVSNTTGSQTMWAWDSLHVISGAIIVTVANVNPYSFQPEDESNRLVRVVFYEVSSLKESEYGETSIEKVGEYILKGRSQQLGFYEHGDEFGLLYVDASQLLKSLTVRLAPRSYPRQAQETKHHLWHSHSTVSFSLPLADTLLRRGSPNNDADKDEPSRLTFEDEVAVGKLDASEEIIGMKIESIVGTDYGAWWSENEIGLFVIKQGELSPVGKLESASAKCVIWVNQALVRVVFPDRIDTYSVQKTGDAGNPSGTVNDDVIRSERSSYEIRSTGMLKLNPHEIFCFTGKERLQILSTRLRKSSSRIVELQSPRNAPCVVTRAKAITKRMWSTATSERAKKPRITSILPLELSLILLAYSNGHIRKSSLKNLIFQVDPGDLQSPFDAAILSLHIVRKDHPRKTVIVGGGDDGSVNFWEFSSLKLRGRTIAFVEPLSNVCFVEDEGSGKLRGCSLCISQDGTIAVVAMDALELLYLIPGSPGALQTMHISSESLMLSYADGRSRLWDIRTREFWRSMSSDKSNEYLSQGRWFSPSLKDDCLSPASSLSVLNKSSSDGDPPPVLMIDIPSVIQDFSNELSRNLPTTSVSIVDLKAVLAIILRPGLDSSCDKLVNSIIGVPVSGTNIGSFDAHMNFQMSCTSNAHGVWQMSPEVTAVRLLSALVILRLIGSEGGHDGTVNALMSFLTTSLPDHVGSLYQAPSLAFLAYHWTESPVCEVRLGAKPLFEAEVSRRNDLEIMAVVENWQLRLPTVLPDREKQSKRAALALCVCGNIAIDRYNLLSASTLTEIAKSIGTYLYDETSPYRALAIDICSRGFDIWQHHFDAMDALRSLFTLATSTRKETLSVRNPGPQARLAVLQIASSNSPLFVTTLSLDIMHPRSVEYSKSVMQVIAFLIRKKPLVLYPSLPRLLEAVVKSLDPGNSSGREAVIDTVTEILGFVVRNFPTIDFSSHTQRLAVGTSEGAVIMYDLKTATRLYVLEGHKSRLTGVSFSPDGRRLVTLSLDESVLLVWKVGSSFTSLFYPGAPPRQGHGGSDPYKKLSIKTGNEGSLSLEETFTQVKFEWPGDRSVKVTIQESVFTINT